MRVFHAYPAFWGHRATALTPIGRAAGHRGPPQAHYLAVLALPERLTREAPARSARHLRVRACVSRVPCLLGAPGYCADTDWERRATGGRHRPAIWPFWRYQNKKSQKWTPWTVVSGQLSSFYQAAIAHKKNRDLTSHVFHKPYLTRTADRHAFTNSQSRAMGYTSVTYGPASPRHRYTA